MVVCDGCDGSAGCVGFTETEARPGRHGEPGTKVHSNPGKRRTEEGEYHIISLSH